MWPDKTPADIIAWPTLRDLCHTTCDARTELGHRDNSPVIRFARKSHACGIGVGSNLNARGMVLPDRIELSTSPLPRECSTTELRQLAPLQAAIGRQAVREVADMP